MFLNFFLQTSTVVSDTVSSVASNANTTAGSTDSVSYLDFILKGGIMIIPIIILLLYLCNCGKIFVNKKSNKAGRKHD